jgi:predicted small lipoprotein YifL
VFPDIGGTINRVNRSITRFEMHTVNTFVMTAKPIAARRINMPAPSRTMLARFAFAALIGLSLALSGCGRKPELYAPGAKPVKPGDTEARQKENAKVPERHFFLDPLL